VPTMNDVAIKAIALAGCTFISIRAEGWSRSYLMRASYLMAQLRRRNCAIAAGFVAVDRPQFTRTETSRVAWPLSTDWRAALPFSHDAPVKGRS
jgi:hypothetical protein